MKRKLPKEFIADLGNPAWLCFAWIGLAAGVTLVAIPAIFGSPATDREGAIGVASAVFELRDRADIGMLVLLLILVRTSTARRGLLFPALGVTLVVVLQSAWLLPRLVQRAAMIAEGITPEPSMAHAAYSTLEIGKILLLLYLAFASMRAFRRSRGAG